MRCARGWEGRKNKQGLSKGVLGRNLDYITRRWSILPIIFMLARNGLFSYKYLDNGEAGGRRGNEGEWLARCVMHVYQTEVTADSGQVLQKENFGVAICN